MMDIRGLAYVVAQTTDVPRWKNFAENVLGMMTAATPDGGLHVGMGDDSGLSQKDHAAHNQALLRRMAQQMLQADTSVKAGLKAKRKRAGWDLTYLERVMGLCI